MTTWGLVTTVLAPARDILSFAAYHLELGAHRIYLYLDEPNEQAFPHLKAHSKVRVQTCDKAHWKKLIGKRPGKHQVRQTMNATNAYRKRAEVDWLIHMDVDEFLVPSMPVTQVLAMQADETPAARVRPMELLGGGDGRAFKAFIPAGFERERTVATLYPTFADYLKGGFLSHIAGKIFVRTGMDDIELRIHNVFQHDKMIRSVVELPQMDLAHLHAKSWEDWRDSYAYRLEKGSYRSEMKPAHDSLPAEMNLHGLFSFLMDSEGEEGLRKFYDEVVADTPEMRARQEAAGLLRLVDLNLDAMLEKHFPKAASSGI